MKRRRILALLISLAITLTYMPALAFADSETPDNNGNLVQEDIQSEAPETEPGDANGTVIPDTDETAGASDDVVSEPGLVLEKEEAVNSKAGDPANISEDDADEAEQLEITGSASGSLHVKPGVDLADSDELLMEYLEQGMPNKENASGGLRKAASATRGSKLDGNSRKVYVMLYNAIVDLTDDDKAEVSTQYGIYAKDLTLEQTSFTKEQLGVSKLLMEKILQLKQ